MSRFLRPNLFCQKDKLDVSSIAKKQLSEPVVKHRSITMTNDKPPIWKAIPYEEIDINECTSSALGPVWVNHWETSAQKRQYIT